METITVTVPLSSLERIVSRFNSNDVLRVDIAGPSLYARIEEEKFAISYAVDVTGDKINHKFNVFLGRFTQWVNDAMKLRKSRFGALKMMVDIIIEGSKTTFSLRDYDYEVFTGTYSVREIGVPNHVYNKLTASQVWVPTFPLHKVVPYMRRMESCTPTLNLITAGIEEYPGWYMFNIDNLTGVFKP